MNKNEKGASYYETKEEKKDAYEVKVSTKDQVAKKLLRKSKTHLRDFMLFSELIKRPYQ